MFKLLPEIANFRLDGIIGEYVAVMAVAVAGMVRVVAVDEALASAPVAPVQPVN